MSLQWVIIKFGSCGRFLDQSNMRPGDLGFRKPSSSPTYWSEKELTIQGTREVLAWQFNSFQVCIAY